MVTQRRLRTGRVQRHRLRSGAEVTIGTPVGPLDPNLAVPTVDEALAAIERFPVRAGWEEVRDGIVPVFLRARPSSLDMPEAITAFVEPGVTIAFAVDLGPAFARVTPQLLDGWSIDEAQLQVAAFVNLRRLARSIGPGDVMRQRSDDGYTIGVIQPRGGWGSTLLLLPDELRRVFGERPQIFIAPMRAVLISFPAHVDRATVAFFAEEFEALDPSHLLLEGFVLRDGRLTIEALPRTMAARGRDGGGAQMS